MSTDIERKRIERKRMNKLLAANDKFANYNGLNHSEKVQLKLTGAYKGNAHVEEQNCSYDARAEAHLPKSRKTFGGPHDDTHYEASSGVGTPGYVPVGAALEEKKKGRGKKKNSPR